MATALHVNATQDTYRSRVQRHRFVVTALQTRSCSPARPPPWPPELFSSSSSGSFNRLPFERSSLGSGAPARRSKLPRQTPSPAATPLSRGPTPRRRRSSAYTRTVSGQQRSRSSRATAAAGRRPTLRFPHPRTVPANNCIKIGGGLIPEYYVCQGCQTDEAMKCVEDLRLNISGEPPFRGMRFRLWFRFMVTAAAAGPWGDAEQRTHLDT